MIEQRQTLEGHVANATGTLVIGEDHEKGFARRCNQPESLRFYGVGW